MRNACYVTAPNNVNDERVPTAGDNDIIATSLFCLPDDDVYMENEADRTEYVLRETGRIWLGKVGKFCVRPWNFGQVWMKPYICHLNIVLRNSCLIEIMIFNQFM